MGNVLETNCRTALIANNTITETQGLGYSSPINNLWLFDLRSQYITFADNTIENCHDAATQFLINSAEQPAMMNFTGNTIRSSYFKSFLQLWRDAAGIDTLYMRDNLIERSFSLSWMAFSSVNVDIQYNKFLNNYYSEVGNPVFISVLDTSKVVISYNIFSNTALQHDIFIQATGEYLYPNFIDLRYNYWGLNQNPATRISRNGCMPIRTLPYLKDNNFTSELVHSGYIDQVVSDTVIVNAVYAPFGLYVYHSSLTILPGSIIVLQECGIELRGFFNFTADGTPKKRIVITSQATTDYPILNYNGFTKSNYNLSYIDIVLDTSSRQTVIGFGNYNAWSAVTNVYWKGVNIATSSEKVGHFVKLSNSYSTSAIVFSDCSFSGNSKISIIHPGMFLMENCKVRHNVIKDGTTSVVLDYIGGNLTIRGSSFSTDYGAIQAQSSIGSVLVGNTFQKNQGNVLGSTVPVTTVTLIGNAQIVDNVFQDLTTPCVLKIRTTEGNPNTLLQRNSFLANQGSTAGSSIITIDSLFTMYGYNNTLSGNVAESVLRVISTRSDPSLAKLEWQYNTMDNPGTFNEITSAVPSDVRYNFWGKASIPYLVTRNSIRSYEINPFLNFAAYISTENVTDCVAMYGRQVNSTCGFGTCYSYTGLESQVCSGHGMCNMNSTCLCDAGYYGDRCDQFSCFNMSRYDPKVCMYGTCVAPDTCECKPLQNGPNCEISSCNGISGRNASVCSGNGRCTSVNYCECNTGYSGQNCETWSCGNSTRIRTEGCPDGCTFRGDYGCNLRGACISYDQCNCTVSGFYGQFCEFHMCFGHKYDSPNVCSGRGVCTAKDTCKCTDPRYSGSNCDQPVCFSNYGTSACHGNGACISPDNCKCYVGYTGEKCDLPQCNGLHNNQTGVCNNRGTCIKPEVCQCNLNSLGQYCETCVRGQTGIQCSDFESVFDRDLAIGLTIGICSLICILSGLIVLPFVVLYLRKRRKQQSQEIELKLLLNERLVSDGDENSHEEWIIDRDDLEFEERISEGAFGVVFKGMYKRKIPVAIKKLKINDSHGEFESEVRILKSLRHPNIILFMGVCIQEEYKYIVTELMAGNLQSLMHSKTKSNKIKHRVISFNQKIDILLQVVGGMIYLHSLSPQIIHRDLKPSNILLDKNHQNAKVCDFGSSTTIAQQKTMTGNVGTLTYMSPEVIRHKSYGEKCDVYSFGIIMYEVFFEIDAYSNEFEKEYGNLFNLAIAITQDGKRPTIPDSIEYKYTEQEETYFDIMRRCWSEDAIKRPTFVEICETLEALL